MVLVYGDSSLSAKGFMGALRKLCWRILGLRHFGVDEEVSLSLYSGIFGRSEK